MKHISLPKKFLVEDIEAGRHAKVVIEPCFPGYGMTLGNSLRRVMLSSLSGGAITAVKIRGVQHEFSSLDGVSDDMLEVILNLKNVRVRVYSDEPVTLNLKAKGQKQVTAADITSNADAEVINPDVYITSLTDAKAELDMELTVAKGIGYVPVEEQGKGKGEIGVILTDAIFTPVVNVGLDVEATRVGQKTDFDRIILDVTTDGTITPGDAVRKAAEILVNQFTWVMEGGERVIEEIDIEAPAPEIVAQELSSPDESNVPPAPELPEEAVAETEAEDEPKPKKRGRPKKEEV